MEHLPDLEEKVAQIRELEARLEKSEQEKIAHSREATQFHEDLEELKVKQNELQDVVTVAVEHESAFMKQIINLEASICFKTEETDAVKEKRARMEERFKKIMEQNQEHARTNTNLF